MTEFFVIMKKRSDGKVYADLHKSCEKVYLIKEDAEAAYDKETTPFRNSFHVVRLIAYTEEEHALTVEQDLQKYYEKRAALPIEK